MARNWSEGEGRGAYRVSWKDILDNAESLHGRFGPLISFVSDKVPKDMLKSSDFELPEGVRYLWSAPQYRKVRDLLHEWRSEFDDSYSIEQDERKKRERQARARERWSEAARRADEVRELVNRSQGKSTAHALATINMVVATLLDENSRPNDRMRAVQALGQVEAEFAEEDEDTQGAKEEELRAMRIQDLIVGAVGGPDKDPWEEVSDGQGDGGA